MLSLPEPVTLALQGTRRALTVLELSMAGWKRSISNSSRRMTNFLARIAAKAAGDTFSTLTPTVDRMTTIAAQHANDFRFLDRVLKALTSIVWIGECAKLHEPFVNILRCWTDNEGASSSEKGSFIRYLLDLGTAVTELDGFPKHTQDFMAMASIFILDHPFPKLLKQVHVHGKVATALKEFEGDTNTAEFELAQCRLPRR